MTEQKLKEYFENTLTAEQLSADIKDSLKKTSPDVVTVLISSISHGEFKVTKDHLLQLCNDTLNGLLLHADLNLIAFTLISSDFFYWDDEIPEGKIIADVIFDWDNPEINFPITTENVLKWKEYILTGNYQLN